MTTQNQTIEKVSPKDLSHDDKVIINGEKAIVDDVYPAGDSGNYAIALSFGGHLDTVIIQAGDTVDRI